MDKMEKELKELLLEWEVDEEYIQNFYDQKIFKIRTLKLLKESSLQKLFPDEGPLLEFKDHFEKYMAGQSVDNNGNLNASVAPNQISNGTEEFRAGPERNETDESQQALLSTPTSRAPGRVLAHNRAGPDKNGTPDPPTIQATTPRAVGRGASSSTNLSQFDDPDDIHYDLEKLLKDHLNGQLVLSFYITNKKLVYKMRCLLADCMLSAYLRCDNTKRFPFEVEKAMTAHVIKLFPTEEKELWQSPKANQREKASGRGLFVTRYYALRRQMLKNNLIQRKSNPTSEEERIDIDDCMEWDDNDKEVFEEELMWLKHNKHPWSRVQDYWEHTSKYRTHQLATNHSIEVHDYLSSYPALNDPSGYLLIEMDFNNLYPMSNMKLYSEWPMLEGFIMSKIPKKVKDDIEASFTPEGKKVRVLRALPWLLPVVTGVKKGKAQWRPSRLESADTLMMLVKVEGDIETTMKERKKKYAEYSLPHGPLTVLVGQDEDHIVSSYIYVNNMRYVVENPMKALDITFKALHALDAVYNREIHRECLFLQKAVYNIELKDNQLVDKHTTELIRDYGNFKNS